MKWQPIETAPKDGSHIQLYRPEIQFTGFFSQKGWIINAPNLPEIGAYPTHWMPLPEPPEGITE